MLLHGSLISLSTTLSCPSQTISHKPQPQHLIHLSKPSATLAKPCLSPTTMPHLMLPNQHLSSAPQMPPSPGATHLLHPLRSSGTPLTLSPSPLTMKKKMSKPSCPSHYHQPLQPLQMCHPYLNASKTSMRSTRHFIPSPSHMHH